uniref:Uncharacterized protein n=1 Tax=Anguilla anguilla TaxID=7936 RepID=A0A0E9SYL5_ANGAN
MRTASLSRTMAPVLWRRKPFIRCRGDAGIIPLSIWAFRNIQNVSRMPLKYYFLSDSKHWRNVN